jgi:hypothetical protein
MRQKFTILLVFTMFIVPLNAAAQTNAYDSSVASGHAVIWDVEIATNFTLWYTEGGYCVVENNSVMSFGIGSVDEDVFGILDIGNVSVYTNDTMVALDLTLGVWPSWLPGLFIEVGQDNVNALNQTAFAAAERISGNWMNGTMSSNYENITIGETEYECITFDYEQDPPGTQVTHMAYSLMSGILIEADTSVTFGSTYRLVLSFREVVYPTPVDLTADPTVLIIVTGVGGGVLLALIVLYVKLSHQK